MVLWRILHVRSVYRAIMITGKKEHNTNIGKRILTYFWLASMRTHIKDKTSNTSIKSTMIPTYHFMKESVQQLMLKAENFNRLLLRLVLERAKFPHFKALISSCAKSQCTFQTVSTIWVWNYAHIRLPPKTLCLEFRHSQCLFSQVQLLVSWLIRGHWFHHQIQIWHFEYISAMLYWIVMMTYSLSNQWRHWP